MSSARALVTAAVVATLCGIGAAAGCTAAEREPTESPSPAASGPAAATPGPVTLRFAVYGEKGMLEAYAELAEAFMRRNPQVTVEVSSAPATAVARSAIGSRLGDASSPDVFLAARQWLPSLVKAGRVRPVDLLLEERGVDFGDGFQRHGLEAFSADSALQCMPHDVSPLVVYYNQRLLDPSRLVLEPGEDPPTARTGWSFEQFALASRRTSAGRSLGVHIDPDLEMLAPFIWSAGGELVDDQEAPTSLTLTDGDSRAALQQVLTLVRDPEVTPTSAQLSRQDAISRFRQGKLAMMLGTRSVVPSLRSAPRLDFEAFPVPSFGGFSTITATTGYCLSTDTEHVAAAADFIAFAVGPVGARITSRSGYVVPSNVEVARSRAFTQPGRQPANSFVFRDGVRRADEVPLVVRWPRVLRETRPLLERLFYSPVIDLDASLERIDRRSQTILAPDVPPETD